MRIEIIILQPLGTEEIPPHLHDKVRVIYQSVAAGSGAANRRHEIESEF
jgi:hypothetical protein